MLAGFLRWFRQFRRMCPSFVIFGYRLVHRAWDRTVTKGLTAPAPLCTHNRSRCWPAPGPGDVIVVHTLGRPGRNLREVNDVAFSPDGTLPASGSTDTTARLIRGACGGLSHRPSVKRRQVSSYPGGVAVPSGRGGTSCGEEAGDGRTDAAEGAGAGTEVDGEVPPADGGADGCAGGVAASDEDGVGLASSDGDGGRWRDPGDV